MSDTATEERCRRCEEELKGLEIQYDTIDRQAWQFGAERERAGAEHESAKERRSQADERRSHWQRERNGMGQFLERSVSEIRRLRAFVSELEEDEESAKSKKELPFARPALRAAEESLSNTRRLVREANAKFQKAQNNWELANEAVGRAAEALAQAKKKMVELQAKKNTVGNRLYRKRNERERVCNPW